MPSMREAETPQPMPLEMETRETCPVLPGRQRDTTETLFPLMEPTDTWRRPIPIPSILERRRPSRPGCMSLRPMPTFPRSPTNAVLHMMISICPRRIPTPTRPPLYNHHPETKHHTHPHILA